MNKINEKKGNDDYLPPPPPIKPRILRPVKNFMWKSYLTIFVIFIIMTVLIVGFFGFINFIVSDRPDAEFLRILEYGSILYFGIWLILGTLYVILFPFYLREIEYIVHGDMIIVKKGIITKTVKHVPYRTVTNIDMKTGIFDRLFGIGTVEIQTAGGSSTNVTSEEKLEGIKIYREVRDYIVKQLRTYHRTKGQKLNNEFKENDILKTTDDIQEEILMEIREIKNIFKEERKW